MERIPEIFKKKYSKEITLSTSRDGKILVRKTTFRIKREQCYPVVGISHTGYTQFLEPICRGADTSFLDCQTWRGGKINLAFSADKKYLKQFIKCNFKAGTKFIVQPTFYTCIWTEILRNDREYDATIPTSPIMRSYLLCYDGGFSLKKVSNEIDEQEFKNRSLNLPVGVLGNFEKS